jgi:hypothetical protein
MKEVKMQFGQVFTQLLCYLFFVELAVFFPAQLVITAVSKASFTRNQKCVTFLLSLAVVSFVYALIPNNILNYNYKESEGYNFIIAIIVAFIMTMFVFSVVKRLSADSSKKELENAE